MSEIDVVVGQIVPVIGAAVGAYGVAVLNRTEDAAASATVRLGQRLLALILRRAGKSGPIEAAVSDLAVSPAGDPDAMEALRLQIREVLARDEVLVAELAALLTRRPGASATGPRSVAVTGDNSGIISTGDNAQNIQRR